VEAEKPKRVSKNKKYLKLCQIFIANGAEASIQVFQL
jgi:hypothetical protein